MKINQNVSPSAFRVEVWLPLALMIAVCVAGSLIHYLLFHTIAEMLSIIIAFTVNINDLVDVFCAHIPELLIV